MQLRWILMPVIALLFAGCGAPEAKFADGERTGDLIPPARKAVQTTVADTFGTPQDLVAWMVFPVDYGEIPGEVVGGSEDGSHRFRARLFAGSDRKTELTRKQLDEIGINRMGLLWTGGEYQQAVYETKKKGEQPAYFQVMHYRAGSDDSAEIELAVNYKLQQAVQPGDTFVLVGHKLQAGRKLFMQHCMHCHGVAGDGAGPTGKYLNPRPRDYRLGRFKFKSTNLDNRANRDDLQRIVTNGIPGTYMPSFRVMLDDPAEMHAVVEYVRWLSIRGEYETALARKLADAYSKDAYKSYNKSQAQAEYEKALQKWKTEDNSDPDFKPNETDFLLDKRLEKYLIDGFPGFTESEADKLAKYWADAESDAVLVTPPVKRHAATPDSIARGRQLYLSGTTKCAECHGQTGRGDGSQTLSIQENATAFPGGRPPGPGLYDDWGHPIKPRDLTRGEYRGGRRPIDLYRRIAIGIKGTPMPGFLGTVLQPDEIWDVVNYVMSIPYGGEGPPTLSGTAGGGAKKVASND